MSACQTRRISRQMWPEKVESSRQSKEFGLVHASLCFCPKLWFAADQLAVIWCYMVLLGDDFFVAAFVRFRLTPFSSESLWVCPSCRSRLSSSITGLQTRGKRPDGRSLSLYSSKPELILWPALDHQLSYVMGWKKLRCEEVEAWEMISAE